MCGETRYNIIPQWWSLDLSTLGRRMAMRAMSPAAKADNAATTKAGELPPPNNWSHGPLPRDTITCSMKSNS